jgi:hypothetical protein
MQKILDALRSCSQERYGTHGHSLFVDFERRSGHGYLADATRALHAYSGIIGSLNGYLRAAILYAQSTFAWRAYQLVAGHDDASAHSIRCQFILFHRRSQLAISSQ